VNLGGVGRCLDDVVVELGRELKRGSGVRKWESPRRPSRARQRQRQALNISCILGIHSASTGIPKDAKQRRPPLSQPPHRVRQGKKEPFGLCHSFPSSLCTQKKIYEHNPGTLINPSHSQETSCDHHQPSWLFQTRKTHVPCKVRGGPITRVQRSLLIQGRGP
jgi:hypothetical protein